MKVKRVKFVGVGIGILCVFKLIIMLLNLFVILLVLIIRVLNCLVIEKVMFMYVFDVGLDWLFDCLFRVDSNWVLVICVIRLLFE